MTELEQYRAANRYINEGLIRRQTPSEPNPRTRREWMEWLLPALRHPQRHYRAVHVAGTSGKGSVATMVAQILHAAGVRVGLHVSPYLQVATEKLWAHGQLASASDYHDLVAWIRPIAEARRGPQVPLHGLASVAIALEYFRRQGVDVAVMEAGVGGRSDLTNVMDTAVAVITSVGLDHVKTLGPGLDSIAHHKAGIIRAGSRAVVLAPPDGAHAHAVTAARAEAARVGAPLRVVTRDSFDARVDPTTGRTVVRLRGARHRIDELSLDLVGPFQGENAALALAAVEELEQAEGIVVETGAVRAGLARARLPGRVERVAAGRDNPCPVLLDGAHNPDKLAAMLGAVEALRARRIHVVYGALAARAPDTAILRLARLARSFVVSQPHVYQKSARAPADLCQLIRRAIAPRPRLMVVPDPPRAVEAALDAARPDDLVLVTGSLYLCGEARERWYPWPTVLRARSSWPGQPAGSSPQQRLAL